MRVADCVALTAKNAGISQVFMVTGGGAMHLNDAFCRTDGLNVLFMHHEQACSMAAEGYSRTCNRIALVNVTTGPGGINSLNGVFGAYTDSIPMLIISGQVKSETLAAHQELPLRQLGDQEADILTMVKGITKHAEAIKDPNDTAYVIERAIWIALSGRPGPVWIDIPIDIQGAQIDETKLRHFLPTDQMTPSHPNEAGAIDGLALSEKVEEVLALIRASKRPVVLPGTGIRASDSVQLFTSFIDKLGIPVATAFNAHDLLDECDPLNVGKAGTVGDRAGNFAVQNADLVLILGCRLNIRQISYNWSSFARSATKIMVDIDRAELYKHTLSIDLPVHCHLKNFLIKAIDCLSVHTPSRLHSEYLNWCQVRKARYPTALPEYFKQSSPINSYAFGDILWRSLSQTDIIVTANATACIVTFQTARVQLGQRLFSNSGSASMGYDLPAAIGAQLAAGNRCRVICIAGDGSIMMNLQELQTIVGNNIPVKIFLLNNSGYSSIFQSQSTWFSDNIRGCGPSNGVSFPDFQKISRAFDLDARRISHLEDAPQMIDATLRASGPSLCEVMLDPQQSFAPKLSSRRRDDGSLVSSALEDMAPFLPRDEFAENMLIEIQD